MSLLTRLRALVKSEPGATASSFRLTRSEADASTSTGTARGPGTLDNPLGAAFSATEIFTVGESYQAQVEDATRLAEENIIFKGIIDHLARTVAQPATNIEVPAVAVSNRRATKFAELFASFLKRIAWEEQKETLVRRLLNEGGLSWEIVLNEGPNRDQVRALEYRPHFHIRPLLDMDGRFVDTNKAYRQLDYLGREKRLFARWQLVDLNLVESAFHNRGVPHLAAARSTLQNIGLLLRGLTQKWIRAGGSIEHFNLADATRWGDVENFKQINQKALDESPDALIRQFFTKGKAEIKRLHGDESAKSDTELADFMMDLVFFAAGCPKAALGFRSTEIVKDMANMVWQNYNQTLDAIERKLFQGLDAAFRLEVLLAGEIPEDFDYRFIGGEFEPTSTIKAEKDVVDAGAMSLNELRRASGAEADPDPLFDVPGFKLTPEDAQQMAVARGVAPEWLAKMVTERLAQKADMAVLARNAAVAAAGKNTDPTKTNGARPPSAPSAKADTPPSEPPAN